MLSIYDDPLRDVFPYIWIAQNPVSNEYKTSLFIFSLFPKNNNKIIRRNF